MLSKIIDYVANQLAVTKVLKDEVAEFRALKTEINKARCVIEFDAEGIITQINGNALNALGYDESELISHHHRTLVGRTEASSQTYKAFWPSLAAGESQTGIFQLQNKQGDTVWFQGYYAPVLSENKSLVKTVAYLTDISKDKQSSIELEGEDTALHQSFGIMECDLNGKILDCNELFVKPLAYAKDELIGKHVSMFLDPKKAEDPEYKKMWQSLSAGEKSHSIEIKRIAKTGEEYWFQSTYVPVKNEHAKPVKVVVYSYCITEEKKKNAEFQGHIDAINKIQAVIEFDLKGNILAANKNFANATGYTLDEIIGNHHSMFVTSDEKNSESYKKFWEKLSLGEAIEGLYHRLGKADKDVWLQASYNPVYGLDGKVYKVVKYATDVTQLKLVEIENVEKLASIDRALGVVEFTMDGRISKVNKNFSKLTGYSESEVIDQHHSMFVDANYKNGSEYKALWEKLNNGVFDTGDYKRIGKDGKEIWLQASYNPILDMHGKPVKVVKFAMDITEQHAAAEVLALTVEESHSVIERAKEGDLISRISLDGKTGSVASLCNGINALMDKMTEIVLQVTEAGETIHTAAGEIATGNNDLSSRTEEQASSLEETASSMEELASTVKQNAENALQANQLATAASGVAIKGGQVVGKVVNTMSAINESAQKIEDIISVIDGIAFQTNILALNAAVEAARAGEQGRGFAVVAGEVRNLAQRSASAAKEIKELINDSVSKTSEGTKLVEDAGQTMQEVVDSVQRVTDIMGEISAASTEQSTGIDQVNTAITNMDEVTQQNAALVEEAAAAAESLVEQANSLMETVSSFKVKGIQRQERRASSSPMRSPAKPAMSKTVAKSAPKQAEQKIVAKTGTDDGDWEEF